MVSFTIDVLVQPALVGVMVAMKDLLYDGYLPESPHLWVDVALHVFAKLVSSSITYEFLIPNLGCLSRFGDPVMHGVISGLIKENFLDTNPINAIGFLDGGNNIPPVHYYTFQTGFIEGLSYGGISEAVAYMADSILD